MLANDNGAGDFTIAADVSKFIGAQLRRLREQRGDSARDFAERTGLSTKELLALERGKRLFEIPQFLHIVAISGALPSYFLFGAPLPPGSRGKAGAAPPDRRSALGRNRRPGVGAIRIGRKDGGPAVADEIRDDPDKGKASARRS